MAMWKAGTSQIILGSKSKNLIESLRIPDSSNTKFIIDSMIENIKNYSIQMENNHSQIAEGTTISFISPRLPKFEVEYNTQIVGLESVQLFSDITKRILETKCKYFYAQLLIGAGHKSILYPNGYRLKCNDLNQFAINSIYIPADMAFSYEVDVLKIYVSFKNDKYYAWCRLFGHLSQLDNGWVKEIQSIQLDSAIDYNLFPAVDLNYQHY